MRIKHKIHWLLSRFSALTIILLIGFFICYKQLPPYYWLDSHISEISKVISSENQSVFSAAFNPHLFRKAAASESSNQQQGCAIDNNFKDNGYLLYARYSAKEKEPLVDLIYLRTNELIHQWRVTDEDITKKIRRFKIQHPLLEKDGGLVFHSNYSNLIKIDKDGQVLWVCDGAFHHSIEKNHNGNYVIPFNNVPNKITGFDFLIDDGYAIVTPEGELIEEHSMVEILMENQIFGPLLGAGNMKEDILHINDAQPILNNVGIARRGDIAFSFRNLSLVALYRPSTKKIVWWDSGPYLNQHDIDLLPDGRFSILNNGVVLPPRIGNMRTLDKPMVLNSGVVVVDPRTGHRMEPYKYVMDSINFITNTQGRCELLPNGDLFLEQTDHQKLLRVSSEKIRWEITNNASENSNASIHWSRYLSPDQVPDILKKHIN